MSQINTTDPVAATGGSPVNRFSEMSSEDFLEIMFTELSNQDPFEPNDSAALLDQLDSIRSIESDVALQEQLESLVFQNQFAAGANLIGEAVIGKTAQFEQAAGVVISISREASEVLLELDTGQFVPFDNIERMVDLVDAPIAAPDTEPAESDESDDSSDH